MTGLFTLSKLDCNDGLKLLLLLLFLLLLLRLLLLALLLLSAQEEDEIFDPSLLGAKEPKVPKSGDRKPIISASERFLSFGTTL